MARSVTFLLPEWLLAAVEELAVADRRRRSDVLRLAVEEFVAGRGVRVSASPVRVEPAAPSRTPEQYVVRTGPPGVGKGSVSNWPVTPDPLDEIA